MKNKECYPKILHDHFVIFLCICLLFIFIIDVVHNVASAQKKPTFTLGLAAAGKGGVYYTFGKDMSLLANYANITLNVFETKGSNDNLELLSSPDTSYQLAVVQSDVLKFHQDRASEGVIESAEYVEKLRFVAPLHYEEIHLITNNDEIKEFDDIRDFTVAVGHKDSGTFVTAQNIFNITGIKPFVQRELNADQALNDLLDRKIDAMFYVVGYPAPLFKDRITAEDNIRIIKIDRKELDEFYGEAFIPASYYKNIKFNQERIKTISVRSALITFAYEYDRCDQIKTFSTLLQFGINFLKERENAHPKWRSVSLYDYKDIPIKWIDDNRYRCVAEIEYLKEIEKEKLSKKEEKCERYLFIREC